MFQFPGFPTYDYLIHHTFTGSSPAWFPNSDIRGSSLICSYPRLFAACHVLLRLLMPRHSPYALPSLNLPCVNRWVLTPHFYVKKLSSRLRISASTQLFSYHDSWKTSLFLTSVHPYARTSLISQFLLSICFVCFFIRFSMNGRSFRKETKGGYTRHEKTFSFFLRSFIAELRP